MADDKIQLNENTMAYEAHPVRESRYPGIVVIHEVTGLIPYIKDICDKLAKEDFVAVAPDLYEGKTAQGMEDGAPLREKVTDDVFRAKVNAALDYLKKQPNCNGFFGVVGFCMGGGFALRAACMFPEEFNACSVFYGRLTDKELLQRLNCPVVGNFGAEDTGITTWATEEFKPEMTKAGKKVDIKVYPGAPHGFARHTTPQAYRPEAAKDALDRTFDLFNSTLRY